jgi:hypothetical protein
MKVGTRWSCITTSAGLEAVSHDKPWILLTLIVFLPQGAVYRALIFALHKVSGASEAGSHTVTVHPKRILSTLSLGCPISTLRVIEVTVGTSCEFVAASAGFTTVGKHVRRIGFTFSPGSKILTFNVITPCIDTFRWIPAAAPACLAAFGNHEFGVGLALSTIGPILTLSIIRVIILTGCTSVCYPKVFKSASTRLSKYFSSSIQFTPIFAITELREDFKGCVC